MKMKKAVLTGVLSLFTFGVVLAQTGIEELPQVSKDYIEQQFPSEQVTYVEKDQDFLSWNNDDMYEVHFSSGLELTFSKAGEITEIDAPKDQAIPIAALPEAIVSFVEGNYSGVGITSWELDGNDQEVELTNGVDLEFDKNGNFKKID